MVGFIMIGDDYSSIGFDHAVEVPKLLDNGLDVTDGPGAGDFTLL
jgi:hypothetical protein